MIRATYLLFLLAILLVVGCSSSNDVVSKGPFQKRKYLPGWHVSAPRAKKDVRSGIVSRAPRPLERSSAKLARMDGEAPEAMDRSLASVEYDPTLSEGHIAEVQVNSSSGTRSGPNTGRLEVEAFPDPPDRGTEGSITEPRHWNRMAILSGVFLFLSALVFAISGGASVMVFLLTFSFITGIIGLILTIKHKERGKGIAIAAIAFPLVLIGLALIVMNSGS